MKKELFTKRYQKLNIKEKIINESIKTILSFEDYTKKDIENTSIEDIKKYVENLITTKTNTYDNLIHIARYYYYINKSENYIHMTKYFNSLGVLENIVDRISIYDSKDTQDDVIKSMLLPPFGTDSLELPKYTKQFLDKLKEYLPPSKCNKILAGNNHNIPKESFDKEKEFYKNSLSLEVYLKERHERKVAELNHYYENNLIWFEQIISKEALDYVRGNQEILSGVLINEKLYTTKIPYEINNFLNEKDEKMKRYYACHCSFVRENILSETEDIPKEWCYCSAGFAKHPYETILEQDLEVKLLKTPLDGDFICRFEIDLSNVKYKK